MQFTLAIACNNAAFTRETADEDNGTPDPGPEVARMLRRYADTLERTTAPIEAGDNWPLLDVNGNFVGSAKFEED